MLLKRALNRLLRFLAPGEILDGYNSAEVIETIFRKAVTYQPDKPLAEAAGKSTVLDFGGGCGVHYRQALLVNPDVRWAIVEHPAVVRRAVELSTNRLQFFTSIKAASDWLGSIDLMHSNCALQYCADPAADLREICNACAREMVWRRTPLSHSNHVERTNELMPLSHVGPGISISRKIVLFQRTLIPPSVLLGPHKGYTLSKRDADTLWFVAQ